MLLTFDRSPGISFRRGQGALWDLMVLGSKMRVCEFYHEDSRLTYILGPVPFGLIRFQVYPGEEEFLDFHLTKASFKAAASP